MTTETPEPSDDDLNRIFQNVSRRIQDAARIQARRRRTGAIVSGGVLALVLTGGTIAVIQATNAEKTVALCYEAADLESRFTEVATPPASGNVPNTFTPLDRRVQAAEESCAAVWRLGVFANEGPPDGGTAFSAPPFTSCLLANGQLGVFPHVTSEFCIKAGLQTP